jgi:hypothetical protein
MVVMDSGLIAEPVIGPRFARTRWGKIRLWDQSDLPCPARFAKIFPFASDPNHFISIAVPAHRGAFRDRHGRWARDAVDAAALARDCVRRAGFDP